MNQETIARGILAGLIDRYIAEIREDPNRSIRKLLDIAERTSDGPTQRICYQMMQQMAENRQSPYYDMIHHLVTHAAPGTIRQFGINLGHNAWTFGSGHLRRLSEANEMPIPWAVLIDRSRTPDRISYDAVSEMIRTGRKQEIYAWMLMAWDGPDEWDLYAKTFREMDDSVFGLCVSPASLTDEILEDAAEIPNLMILLDTDVPDWQECAAVLARKGLLYSVIRRVSSTEDVREILSGSWFEEIVPHHPLMAFTLAGDQLPDQDASGLARYMWDTRLAQTYPVLPVDVISDFMIISRLISQKEVLYRIEPDGTVTEAKGLKFCKSGLQVQAG